jgi:glycosyltransferase involved in cell wall biosynthesis
VNTEIVHLSTADRGGAGNVASTLTQKQAQRTGVKSRLLVGNKQSTDDFVSELDRLPFEYEVTYGIERWLSLDGLGAPSTLYQSLRLEPDVLNLHNLHGSYFNLAGLKLIDENTEIYWTLHDTWPVTGNWVYPYDCDRFTEECGKCPELSAYPSMLFDTTSQLLKLKRSILEEVTVTAICPSRWMKRLVDQSAVSFDEAVYISNGVDTSEFVPINRREARRQLGVSHADDEFTILFVAQNVDDQRKGFTRLMAALNRLGADHSVTVLAVGSNPSAADSMPDSVTYRPLGYVPDESLPSVYNAADLFVIPSLADNCPLTVLESLSCGTPVVGFPVGGIPELLRGGGGWVCERTTAQALASTLSSVCDDHEAIDAAGRQARELAVQNHEIEDVVDRYMSEYGVGD